jgi:hypothetical protein
MSEDTPEQEIERTKSELEEILLRVDSLPISRFQHSRPNSKLR